MITTEEKHKFVELTVRRYKNHPAKSAEEELERLREWYKNLPKSKVAELLKFGNEHVPDDRVFQPEEKTREILRVFIEDGKLQVTYDKTPTTSGYYPLTAHDSSIISMIAYAMAGGEETTILEILEEAKRLPREHLESTTTPMPTSPQPMFPMKDGTYKPMKVVRRRVGELAEAMDLLTEAMWRKK